MFPPLTLSLHKSDHNFLSNLSLFLPEWEFLSGVAGKVQQEELILRTTTATTGFSSVSNSSFLRSANPISPLPHVATCPGKSLENSSVQNKHHNSIIKSNSHTPSTCLAAPCLLSLLLSFLLSFWTFFFFLLSLFLSSITFS